MALQKEPEHETDRVLALIKRRGPQRVADIAVVLGVTGEAARQRVARLAERGLVMPSRESGARGRPAHTWALTDTGHARFPDRHAEVTLALINAVRATFGDAALEQLIAQREAEMRTTYAVVISGASSLRERLRRLAKARSREGYMAEVFSERGAFLFVENHCPICVAASACQNFCRSELDVFRAVLGESVTIERTEYLLAGARRCAYRVKEGSDEVVRRSRSRRTPSGA